MTSIYRSSLAVVVLAAAVAFTGCTGARSHCTQRVLVGAGAGALGGAALGAGVGAAVGGADVGSAAAIGAGAGAVVGGVVGAVTCKPATTTQKFNQVVVKTAEK